MGVLYVPGTASVGQWEAARWRMHRYALGRGYRLLRVFDVDGRPSSARAVYRDLDAWLPVLAVDIVVTCGSSLDLPLIASITDRHGLRCARMSNEEIVFGLGAPSPRRPAARQHPPTVTANRRPSGMPDASAQSGAVSTGRAFTVPASRTCTGPRPDPA